MINIMIMKNRIQAKKMILIDHGNQKIYLEI